MGNTYFDNKQGRLPLPVFSDEDELYEAHLVPYVVYMPPDIPEVRAGLLGALWYLARWFVWQRDPDKRGRVVGQYIKWLLAKHSWQGVVAMLKSENCTLYQSLDNGLTWAPVIDFNECVADATRRAVEPLLREQTEGFLRRLQELYEAGGIPEALPSLVYGDENDGARDIALCNTWQLFVQYLLFVERSRRQGIYVNIHMGLEFVDDLSDGIMSVGLAKGIPHAGKAALVLTVASFLIRTGVQIFQSIDDAILSDTGAASEVACCAYQSMAGQTPSTSLFRDALDSCSFEGNINAQLIAGAVAYLLDDLRMFLAFASYHAELLDLVYAGLLDDCICGAVCTLDWDFSIDEQGWHAIEDPFSGFTTISGNSGSYSAGAGWVHGDMRRSDNSYHRLAAIGIDLAPLGFSRLLQVSVTFDYVKGAYTNTAYHVINYIQGPVGQHSGILSITAADAESGDDQVITWQGGIDSLGRLVVRIRSSGPRATASYEGSVLIKAVRVVGVCDA